MDDRDRRLAALEAHEEIRRLAARHATALDRRDIATLVSLYVDDATVPDGGTGHAALARWWDVALRRYGVTFHLIGNHLVDLAGRDRATGTLYCRAEFEAGERWIVMPLQYWDRYERRDGRWLFAAREEHPFYAADVTENPSAVPGRFALPGHPWLAGADLPERWDSWRRFWQVQR